MSFEIMGPISRNVGFYDMGDHHKLVTFRCPKDSNKVECIHANLWGESDISDARPENKAWQYMVENM
jgi:hypothetical protein